MSLFPCGKKLLNLVNNRTRDNLNIKNPDQKVLIPRVPCSFNKRAIHTKSSSVLELTFGRLNNKLVNSQTSCSPKHATAGASVWSKSPGKVECATAALLVCLCSPLISCWHTLLRWREVEAACFFKGLGLIRWQAEFMELIFHGGVIHGGFGAMKQLNGCSERLAWLVPWND